MITYIVKRLIMLVPLLVLISIVTFALIQLPPGNYVDTYVNSLRARGETVDQSEIDALTRQYGLDKGLLQQYGRWIGNIIFRGDLGRSFSENRLVIDILRERVPLSMILSLSSLLFVYVVGVPIGIFSATHQYSAPDYVFTVIGFIGLSVPNFLLGLILMWFFYTTTGHAVTGLFSVDFIGAPWSVGKLLDMARNIWLPLIVIGTAGTAGLIRVTRANLLDELKKQYVVTARAKGVSESRLIFKYPIRIAFNPIISTIGWALPSLVSGEVLVSIVLNLRTVGPILWNAIRTQDMYLAGSILMILSALSVIGTLLSDILLVAMDPRIRYDETK